MHTFIILFITITTLLTRSKIYTKILSAININRHGARTPGKFDEICSKMYYGSYSSQLIINGLRQQQLLGKWAYKRYILDYNLLTKNYNPQDSLFFSSPVQRAIFSGTGFIQGLYPNYIIKPIFNEE